MTLLQFYNPDFLRGFGVGAINGSLWTISVEIQFYLLTPVVAWLISKRNIYYLSIVIIFFCLLNILNSHLNPKTTIPEKLFNASFVPWIYMYILGGVVSNSEVAVQRILKLKAWVPILIYTIVYLFSLEIGLGTGNHVNPLGYVFLALIIVKLAYSLPTLSDKLLNRNDISYGIYIFHMPIVNYLLYKSVVGFFGFSIAICSTLLIAIISWRLIEKPALSLKSNQLRSLKIR